MRSVGLIYFTPYLRMWSSIALSLGGCLMHSKGGEVGLNHRVLYEGYFLSLAVISPYRGGYTRNHILNYLSQDFLQKKIF
jgi:hypothetical protein